MIHFALECIQRMLESQNVALVSSARDSAEGSTSRICEQRDLRSFTVTIGRISAEYVLDALLAHESNTSSNILALDHIAKQW
uniref:Uncharacterized protein n=1 Tax=viral metagenome TaxID=1070528 RepID=A0A6C0C1B7_9ZZZZ